LFQKKLAHRAFAQSRLTATLLRLDSFVRRYLARDRAERMIAMPTPTPTMRIARGSTHDERIAIEVQHG